MDAGIEKLRHFGEAASQINCCQQADFRKRGFIYSFFLKAFFVLNQQQIRKCENKV